MKLLNLVPLNFYQLLNILSYLPDKDLIITNLTAVLTSKTETIYNYTLVEFQKLLKTLNINIDFSKISFMADFEINLRKAISDNFPNSEIMRCYFHFIKNLYYKMKKLGMTKKKDIKNNLKFLFFFKIFTYIKDENKEQYIFYKKLV